MRNRCLIRSADCAIVAKQFHTCGRCGMRKSLIVSACLLVAYCSLPAIAGIIFNGDGSEERGFPPPPQKLKDPPPPPANMSGGETGIPYPPPPAASQSRSEKKNPPSP